MDILENVNITLTEEDIKNIVANYINLQGYNLDWMEIHIGSRLEGHRGDEQQVKFLKNISVKASKIK